jgi:hypothetical protein
VGVLDQLYRLVGKESLEETSDGTTDAEARVQHLERIVQSYARTLDHQEEELRTLSAKLKVTEDWLNSCLAQFSDSAMIVVSADQDGSRLD